MRAVLHIQQKSAETAQDCMFGPRKTHQDVYVITSLEVIGSLVIGPLTNPRLAVSH